MRSLFRANWRCLYPRAGGREGEGGIQKRTRPPPPLLVYFQKRRSPLLRARRRPLPPLTFELNIPSSPWTGIFYTSPNVVFVYISTGNSSLRPLLRSIVFRGGRGRGKFSLANRLSLIFFFSSFLFQYFDMERRFFWKILIFPIFRNYYKLTQFSLEMWKKIGKDKFYEWFDTRDMFKPGQPCWVFKVWKHVSG